MLAGEWEAMVKSEAETGWVIEVGSLRPMFCRLFSQLISEYCLSTDWNAEQCPQKEEVEGHLTVGS